MSESDEQDFINMEVQNMIFESILPAWEATGRECGVENEDGDFMVSAGLLGSVVRDSYQDILTLDLSDDFETGAAWAFNVILHMIRASGDRVMPLYVNDILSEGEGSDDE